MLQQASFPSYKKSLDVTLKSLLDIPLSCIVTKILDVCIKEKECLEPFQQVMKISAQNKIIVIFNKQPGIVDELYVKANDIVTIESVLYTLTYQNQDIQIVQIQKATPNKKHQKIRINIITQKNLKNIKRKNIQNNKSKLQKIISIFSHKILILNFISKIIHKLFPRTKNKLNESLKSVIYL